MKLDRLQSLCHEFVSQHAPADAAHDIAHVRRVVNNTLQLSESENADKTVTLAAAWLHDCVAVPKDSPLRARSSRLAAERAVEFLRGTDFPAARLGSVFHAIEAHSYSAGVAIESPEAAVVQDADRLDSLGAIGVARCLLVGGKLDRPLCHESDPFCDQRQPDDSRYTLDHFYQKLFKLPATMQTAAGRREAERRAALMQRYLEDLRHEIL
ncbi:MAG: HD domain-containing protein [Xanthomonadales bacterium]|nr:HD domain-containing protein [Xanthomonadales bacterium]